MCGCCLFYKRPSASSAEGAFWRSKSCIDTETLQKIKKTREMSLGLRLLTERVGDGEGQPLLDTENGEELMHVQPRVAIVLGKRAPESPGILYISTKRVLWLSDVDEDRGYAVDFLSVSLHAVSRDQEAYPSPCIYAQIEVEAGDDDESGGSDSECIEDVELSKITEMRLVPSEPSQLDTLFDIFCQCAELNPDPCEEQEDNEWVFDTEQMVEDVATEARDESEWLPSENPANPIGYANGNHDLARTILELQIDDQRFEDAEEIERAAN
eukprot:TRINITY_DN2499_c0_g1_i1.p1 TRINITY_DN2499_c0_g1~~TRINITY_DN2499_c0_g1_i1.p1  ORF type:complete len:269 (+),score=27.86 TRINITY_DN2499_c0_g1_i1:21-827(+)